MGSETTSKDINEEVNLMIGFTIGGEDYGVDIQTVKEVIRITQITRLPKAPLFVKGVINLRGDIIPIIDLREKFGFNRQEYVNSSRIIVTEMKGKSVGMVVDSVTSVIRLNQDDIDPPPPLVGGLSEEYLNGVGKFGGKLIVLLNIDRILSMEEVDELNRIETINN